MPVKMAAILFRRSLSCTASSNGLVEILAPAKVQPPSRWFGYLMVADQNQYHAAIRPEAAAKRFNIEFACCTLGCSFLCRKTKSHRPRPPCRQNKTPG